MEILEWFTLLKHLNKSGPSPLLNVAAYWQSSITKVCAKKLSQTFANNTGNGGRGMGLRIHLRYCMLLEAPTLKYTLRRLPYKECLGNYCLSDR